MAETIRSVRQKLASGAYSDPIPFGANAENISLKNGYDVEAALGNIDVSTKGTVQAQLNKHTTDINTNRTNIESNDSDIAALQDRAAEIEANVADNLKAIQANLNAINSNDIDITNLQNRAAEDEADIQKNATDIATLDKKVDTEVNRLDTKIDTLTDGINNNAEALEKRVAENEVAIETNANDITTINGNIKTLQTTTTNQQTEIDRNESNITTINNTLTTHANNINARVTKEEAKPFIKGVNYNESTFVITFTKYDNTTQTIDLPLENLFEEGYYDTTNKELVIVLSTGATIKIPASDLIDEYTGKTGNQITTAVTNNVVSATLNTKSIDESFLTTALQTRLTTMETNISNRYTKTEVDNLLTNRLEFTQVQSW